MSSLYVELNFGRNQLVLSSKDHSSVIRLVLDEGINVDGERSTQREVFRLLPPTERTEGDQDVIVRGSRCVSGLRRYPAEVDAWLSSAIGVQCHLARQSNGAALSNTSQLLVVHAASHWRVVDEVARSGSSQRVDIEAYRANIVLAGGENQVLDSGFVEHSWSKLDVADPNNHCNVGISLLSDGPCSRCAQLNVTGGVVQQEPLASLSRLCRGWGSSRVLFGQHFHVDCLAHSRSYPPPSPSTPFPWLHYVMINCLIPPVCVVLDKRSNVSRWCLTSAVLWSLGVLLKWRMVTTQCLTMTTVAHHDAVMISVGSEVVATSDRIL